MVSKYPACSRARRAHQRTMPAHGAWPGCSRPTYLPTYLRLAVSRQTYLPTLDVTAYRPTYVQKNRNAAHLPRTAPRLTGSRGCSRPTARCCPAPRARPPWLASRSRAAIFRGRCCSGLLAPQAPTASRFVRRRHVDLTAAHRSAALLAGWSGSCHAIRHVEPVCSRGYVAKKRGYVARVCRVERLFGRPIIFSRALACQRTARASLDVTLRSRYSPW